MKSNQEKKQEHTLFNDLRRKLAKRSKELVNITYFFALFKKIIKFDLDLEWYLCQFRYLNSPL